MKSFKMVNYLKQLFLGSTQKWQLQLLRYCFVGGFAFLVDAGLLYVLTEYAGWHYLFSASLSFIAGLCVNYLLSISWIFKSSTYSNRTLEFVFFAIIGVVGLLLNELLLYMATDVLHLYYMLSKVIAAGIIMLWNFFARKYLLFNPQNKKI